VFKAIVRELVAEAIDRLPCENAALRLPCAISTLSAGPREAAPNDAVKRCASFYIIESTYK
jgi:hypothetical protein